jgi:uncharacterized protein YjeT (DUF2065 family)
MRTEGEAAGLKPDARPVLPALNALFAVASILVLLATVQLFVLSNRTNHYFAWTIGVPLTAAVDGAFYLSSFALLFPAIWARAWADVRPLAWGVLTISTLKLVATLLHTALFHFGATDLTPRIAAWGWLVVYIAVPIVLGALILLELRMPGGDPPVARPMPPALRLLTGALTVVLLLVGLALLLAPTATAKHWPWPLTALTAQALSAWFIGIGVLVGLSVRDGDVVRSRNIWIAAMLLFVLQGIAVVRYSDVFDWDSVSGVLYVALFAGIGALGLWGMIASRSPARA